MMCHHPCFVGGQAVRVAGTCLDHMPLTRVMGALLRRSDSLTPSEEWSRPANTLGPKPRLHALDFLTWSKVTGMAPGLRGPDTSRAGPGISIEWCFLAEHGTPWD